MTRRGDVGDEEARQRGARVKVTEQGWVGAEGAGPEVRAEDAGLEWSDAKLLGIGFWGGYLAGLAVEAVWGGVVLYLHYELR